MENNNFMRSIFYRFLMLILAFAFIRFCSSFTCAADNGAGISYGKPMEHKEAIKLLSKINNIQKTMNVVSATVHQLKKNPKLKKEIETLGSVIIKKPNLLYWDITEPDRHITIVDGKNMWVYQPALKEAKKYILSEHFAARQKTDFLSSTMNMSMEDTEKRFDITVYNAAGDYILEMKPKSFLVAKYLSAIHVWYKEGEGVPYKFEMIGTKGDSTLTEITNVTVNPAINENQFHFEVPEGVAVITDTE